MDATFDGRWEVILFLSLMFLVFAGTMVAKHLGLSDPVDSAERVECAAEIEGDGV